MTGTKLFLRVLISMQWGLLPLLAVTVCLSSCTPAQKYQGDGKFWMINNGQGFHIRFDDFDLSKPFHAQYRIAGCPHAQTGATLLLQVTPALHEDRDLLLGYTDGVLTLEATCKDAAPLFKCEGPLKTWTPSAVYTDGRLVADEYFYMSESVKSFIPADAFKSQSPVTLKVDYQPAPTASSIPIRITGSIHAIGS